MPLPSLSGRMLLYDRHAAERAGAARKLLATDSCHGCVICPSRRLQESSQFEEESLLHYIVAGKYNYS